MTAKRKRTKFVLGVYLKQNRLKHHVHSLSVSLAHTLVHGSVIFFLSLTNSRMKYTKMMAEKQDKKSKMKKEEKPHQTNK